MTENRSAGKRPPVSVGFREQPQAPLTPEARLKRNKKLKAKLKQQQNSRKRNRNSK